MNDKQHDGGVHPSISEMYAILVGEQQGKRESIIKHLVDCPKCLEIFNSLLDMRKEAHGLDIAVPKLAGTRAHQGVLRIDTEGGKYTIIVRPSLKAAQGGVITVALAPEYQEELEGAWILLKDRKGRPLIEGRIVNGQVSQRVEEIDTIDAERFVIECK